MLQQERPDDYVIATGVSASVRDFVRMAFSEVGITLCFEGNGTDEKALLQAVDESLFAERVGAEYLSVVRDRVGDVVVAVDPRYFRPTEVDALVGDARKAREVLGWKPEYDLPALVREMVASDVKLMKRDAFLQAGGYKTLKYFE